MKQNERLEALTLLLQLLESRIPLTHLMQRTPALSPFSKALCFGVCRHYYRLMCLAHYLLPKKPKYADVWLCVLLGLYQLHFLQLPDYAVVKETVSLLDKRKKSWAKGLVNAVLRRYCRENENIKSLLATDPSYQYGHPDWLLGRLKKDWPTHWVSIVTANDEHPPMTLRVNQQQFTRQAYFDLLKTNGREATLCSHAPHALTLLNPCDVKDLPSFETGAVSVQDEGAQLAIALLDLKPDLRLLDACCAPGGKTAYALESEERLEACFALDIDETRLKRVNDNLQRLHLQAIVRQGDALQPETWWDKKEFDRILLDAPCSATGVIRRHPDIKLLRTPAEITTVVHLQKHLLTSLWPLLKNEGLLVYATCSVLPQENEDQIADFVKHHPDCELVPIALSWGIHTGHGWQILPGQNNMDGFFYSVLRKRT